MKKSLLVACLVVVAATLFLGCGAEEIKKLTDQNASLNTEVTNYKAKVAELEKAKTDLTAQVTQLTTERDTAKTAAEACAPKEEKKDDKAAAKGAEKKDDKKGKKEEAKKEDKPKASAGEKKPKFSAPKKAK
ncbi:MAG: hypothetical protein HY897_13330 [Deltaproteobacteria bacterium]|nr:hypothetical protein [Deltaproteobacteria bacterium]